MSGQWDSNPRVSAWKADAFPDLAMAATRQGGAGGRLHVLPMSFRRRLRRRPARPTDRGAACDRGRTACTAGSAATVQPRCCEMACDMGDARSLFAAVLGPMPSRDLLRRESNPKHRSELASTYVGAALYSYALTSGHLGRCGVIGSPARGRLRPRGWFPCSLPRPRWARSAGVSCKSSPCPRPRP